MGKRRIERVLMTGLGTGAGGVDVQHGHHVRPTDDAANNVRLNPVANDVDKSRVLTHATQPTARALPAGERICFVSAFNLPILPGQRHHKRTNFQGDVRICEASASI